MTITARIQKKVLAVFQFLLNFTPHKTETLITLLLLNISNELNYMETTKHYQQKEAYDAVLMEQNRKLGFIQYFLVLQEDHHQL